MSGTARAKRQRGHIAIERQDEEIQQKAPQSEEKEHECQSKAAKSNAPQNWQKVWDLITEMRSKKDAPVDNMGCDKLHDGSADEKTQRYQILTALMLSSQTKDPVTADAIKKLVAHGLTVDNILQTDDKLLDSLISKVGFHNRKTIYIKQTAAILKDKYNGDIPETLEGLLELPGVGKKMAYLTILSAWKRCEGIGVDVHVHRIADRLRWTKKAKDPEDTRLQLESWLPREHWSTINELLVGLGQTVCLPIKPKCSDCLVSGLCPSAPVSLKRKKQKSEKDSDE
eukprot:TRINITY_DN4770_c0_g2_i1.p1 TRINITY_DN4770_c0_g2~~TRINITY_DN4770_c0_g2_i1.p1  ORF type:complete len:284 (-),score=55.96 TRINITY_DN4770_c0_g2_i1:55-906(-)